MSVKKITRQAQNELTAVFKFAHDDTMLNTSGVSKNFGSSDLAQVIDAIKLPTNAIVTGGFLAVTEAFDAASYAVIVGDSGDTDRYMASADVKAVGVTPLLVPGFVNASGLDVRVTIAAADACTTGEAILVVKYIIDGRVMENI